MAVKKSKFTKIEPRTRATASINEGSDHKKPFTIAIIGLGVLLLVAVLFIAVQEGSTVGKAFTQLSPDLFEEGQAGAENTVSMPVQAGGKFTLDVGVNLPAGKESVGYEFLLYYPSDVLSVSSQIRSALIEDWGNSYGRFLDHGDHVEIEHATLDFTKPISGPIRLAQIEFTVLEGQTFDDITSLYFDEGFTVWELSKDPLNLVSTIKQPSGGTIAAATEQDQQEGDSQSQDSTSDRRPSRGGLCKTKWECSGWTYCDNTLHQYQTCVDVSGCAQDSIQERLCDQCDESWVCTQWSACIDGVETRTCSDEHTCGSTFNKPEERRSCAAGQVAPPPSQFGAQQAPPPRTAPSAPSSSFWDTYKWFIIGPGIVLGLVLIGLFIFLLYGKKKMAVTNYGDLEGWIRKEISYGYSKSEMKRILLKSTSWSSNDFEKTYLKVKGGTHGATGSLY